MEDSPIKAHHWCLAFYRAAASKKGVSALQIQGETGLTYKWALFLMHRIRWAMAPANEQESKLGGTVEFDETVHRRSTALPASARRALTLQRQGDRLSGSQDGGCWWRRA